MSKLRNKFEIEVEGSLKRAKVKFQYETEKFPYVLSRHYIPDFVISTRTGKVYLECKGYLRPEHKAKMVAVKKQHPEIDLRILFYAYKKEYVRWAEKNGIKYAIKTIPTEWLEGF